MRRALCSDAAYCVFRALCEITMVSCAGQEEAAPMEMTPQAPRPVWEHYLQAVLALLGGEPVPQVTTWCDMRRSISIHGTTGHGATGHSWRSRVPSQPTTLVPRVPTIVCPRTGTAPGGAGSAPSDLECGADPRGHRSPRYAGVKVIRCVVRSTATSVSRHTHWSSSPAG